MTAMRRLELCPAWGCAEWFIPVGRQRYCSRRCSDLERSRRRRARKRAIEECPRCSPDTSPWALRTRAGDDERGPT